MRTELRVAVPLLAGLLALAASGFGQGTEPVDEYYASIRTNDLAMLNALVNRNGVKCKDKHATTPLHHAAAYGSVDALRADSLRRGGCRTQPTISARRP